MAIPLFALGKAEHVPTINAVLAVLTSGMQQLGAAHTGLTDPLTVTHWAMLDTGAPQGTVDEFAAMTQGILPAITGEWGVNGVPTGAEAVAAMTGGNFIVVPGYGVEGQEQIAQFIAAQRTGFEIAPYSPPGV